jgi:sec-independent protein translocase protein TatC
MAIPLVRRKERPTPDAMTLTEHLGEARRRLIWSVVAFAVCGLLAALFYNQLLTFLLDPYCRVHNKCNLYVTAPLDGLTLRIKMAMFGGLILAAPVILWQLWRFITPGLNKNEKRYIVPFVVASVVLFVSGAVVAYLALPHALRFLDAVGGPHLSQLYNPNSYLNLVMVMMLVFGLTFEFPVLLVALQLANIVSSARLLSWWRWAIVGITVAAAVFTPSGDPFSMLVLAIPLVVFYFVAIGIGKLLGR